MIKRLALVVIFLSSGFVFATPGRMVDGDIQFAIATFDGVAVFTQARLDALVLAKPSGVVVPQTPAQFEINLSTTLVVDFGDREIGFENYSEFLSCQTRAGLKRKVMKIRALIDSMSDLPAVDSKDLRERAGWLKSYYLSLP